ncbi:aspartyl protease family protein [Cryomorphaceae bacterium 1068]|nr:aspartyl protease family protein [Cryomorphaceae bacterium 1068]
MQEGSVEQEKFNVTVPFEYRGGLCFINVEVNGEKAWFLFDTGAPNLVSEKLAERLNLVTETKGGVKDSGGNSTKGNAFVRLEDINVGGVHFKNTGAVIQNLSASDIFKCLEIDGIIGANLMRQAFWKIDYENETMSLSSDLNDFGIDSSYAVLPFDVKMTGTPIIDISFGGVTAKNMIFDTGSNKEFSFPLNYLREAQKRKPISTTWELGATSYGVGGKALADTIFYAVIDTMELSNLTVPNSIVAFDAHSDNFGNAFFKHYDVVLDWKNRKIYMKSVSPYENSTLNSHGYGVNLVNGGMEIGSIYNGSAADGKLEIGDRILKIDEYDFSADASDLICELVNSREIRFKERDVIEMTIERGEEVLTFQLERMRMLPLDP